MTLLLLACNGSGVDSVDSSPPPEVPDYVELGPERVCEDPLWGFHRLEPRELDQALANAGEVDACGNPPGALVAEDLDGDGDPELVLLEPTGVPIIWRNDEGQLVVQEVGLLTEREAYTLAAGDLDGDGLPELLLGGQDLLLVARNRGGLEFSAWETVYDEPAYPRSCAFSLGFGDVDGDGDLDVSVANADHVPDEDHISTGNLDDPGAMAGSADRVFLNEGGRLELWGELDSEPPRMSLLHVWTDRDVDGDLDLLAATDRYIAGRIGLGTSYRNDGSGAEGPLLFEDGSSSGFSNAWSVMGVASWDQDGDGWLDHCFTDISQDLRCLRGDGAGGFYLVEGFLTAPIELHPQVPEDWYEPEDPIWREYAPWSIEVLDVNSDGYEDVFQVAGPVPELGNPLYAPLSPFQPDWLWQGGPEGSVSWGEDEDVLWASTEGHFGLVQLDLDGDGYRELARSGHDGALEVFDNPCHDGGWVEVLVLNDQGVPAYGAQVTLRSGDRVWMREIQGPRVMGQSPAAVHVGLGEADEVDLLVRLPDGVQLRAERLPVNRRVVVRAP
jgi:hypothetical protein